MQGYVIAVSIVAGVSVLAILVYLALRIYKKSTTTGSRDAEKKGLYPPSIVLTSSSPGQSKKRLYSPAAAITAAKDKEEKMGKKEKRKEIKSLWLPKRKANMPIMKATLVQPTAVEHGKEQGGRGRLAFTLHYFYQYASKSSVFIVKLLSAQDLPPKDDELLDVFVKTQLIPSRKRVYISKVHRQTCSPVFNETYEFDIDYQELQQQRLLFQVLDFDCLSRHKQVGHVSVNLVDLGTYGFNILREVSLVFYISRPPRE